MFINNIKISFRNIANHKTNAIINITGFTLGLACFIIIMQYVQFELSYDKYHKNSKRIYRVIDECKCGKVVGKSLQTPGPLAKSMMDYFPEIENRVRIIKSEKALVANKNTSFYEERIIFADPSILDVFSIAFLDGNKGKALANPNSILITETMSKKYFGDENPIGKTLIYNGDHPFKITGVIKDIPLNSHFKYDFLASLERADQIFFPGILDNKRNTPVYTYILLHENASVSHIVDHMREFILQLYGEFAFTHWKQYYYLQPLENIHLHSDIGGEIEPNSDILYIYLLSAIAFLILLIASINYMNLSTARYANRTKEVGMRKVIGASKWHLIGQFISESLLITIISSIFAICLVELLRPIYNSVFNNTISLNLFHNLSLMLVFTGGIFIIGILSGSYPAFFLSSFNPLSVFKKNYSVGKFHGNIRNILMMLQFSLSLILITLSFIIYKQVDFINTKKIGINKEQLIVIPLNDKSLRQKTELIKNELLKNPQIITASASSALPGGINWVESVQWEGTFDDFSNVMPYIQADYDFLKTYKINLADGRDFSKKFIRDASNAFLINETAAQHIGWESAIGKKFLTISRMNGGEIVGVMKDFHFRSLHQKIEPIVIYIDSGDYNYLTIRIGGKEIPSTLNYIADIYTSFSTAYPFKYFFFDQFYDHLYKHERKLLKIASFFSIITIFIACLGLLGISSYTAERRTKEVGIRKILGASIPNIFVLLTMEYNKHILLANILAWPITWYATQFWFQNFAYHIHIKISYFLISSIAILVISLITTSNIIIKVAKSNPADVLRSE